jgi:hypothetical protein
MLFAVMHLRQPDDGDIRAGPRRLSEGDCFVLPAGLPFRLARDLALQAQPVPALFATARRGGEPPAFRPLSLSMAESATR